MKKQTVYKFLIGIFLLGAVLRFSGLGTNSFVADEFLDINSSYGYFQTGEWKAWDFNFGQPAVLNENDARDERAFVYKWQVATLFQVLPPTEATARTVSVLWGLVSLLLIYFAAYFYTGKKTVGLIAAFLFAVSVSAIIFDRRLRMYAMFFPLFLAFATVLFAFFERAYQGKISFIKTAWERFGINLVYLVPVIVLAGLNALVHGLSLTIIPIFGMYVLFMAVKSWKEGKGWKNKYGVMVATGIVSVVLAVLFVPQLVRLGLGGMVWFDNHYSYFGYILRDFAHPLLGALVVVFGSVFLWKKLDRPKESLWLTLCFVVPLSMAVWFWSRNAGPQYIFFAQSFVIMLAATGVYGVLRFAKDHFSIGKQGVLVVVGLSLLLLPNYGYFLEENNTYHETSSGDNVNYRKVFDYFKKNKQDGDVLITRNFRNYYFSGAKVPVYDFGGELSREKFSLMDLQEILKKHPHGWVILSTNDYDYISREAEVYFKKNMEQVSHAQVRGPVEVYRW